jgi:hypothetical protein
MVMDKMHARAKGNYDDKSKNKSDKNYIADSDFQYDGNKHKP